MTKILAEDGHIIAKQGNDSVMDFYMKVKANVNELAEKQIREIFICGLSPENYLETEKIKSGISLQDLVAKLWVLESKRKVG